MKSQELQLPGPDPPERPRHGLDLATRVFAVVMALVVCALVPPAVLHASLGPSAVPLYAAILMLVGGCGWAAIRSLMRPWSDLATQAEHARKSLERLPPGEPLAELDSLRHTINELIDTVAAERRENQRARERFEDRLAQRTEALQEALSRARESSQTKSEFLANMSHELRTPMNGILGMLEVVLDSPLSVTQRDEIETAQRSAHSLLALLNDILDLSKIEAGKMTLERIPVDPRFLIEDVVKAQAGAARQKGLLLSSASANAVPQRVLSDPTRLRQVLSNLLSNALKFTERGLITVSIDAIPLAPGRVRGRSMVDLQFAVRDTGVGIPADKQAAIFEKFTQADGSVTRRYGGTGLGLAITRLLVDAFGGRIWIESEPGRGSTFYFTVPADVVTIVPGADAPEASVSARPLTAFTDSSKRRILVVEDNAVNQKVVSAMLAKRGYGFDVAANGAIALERLAEAHYDVVLMDVQMPVMDGIEATRRIRQEPRWQGLPVIAMTAHAMQGDKERCFEAGMDDYVSKPVQAQALTRVIENVLAGLAADPRQETPAGTRPLPDFSERDPIDREQAARLMDNDHTLLNGMVLLFLQLAPERLGKIDSLLSRGDRAELEAETERLRKAAERIAASCVSESAAWVSQAVRTNDMPGAQDGLALLHREIHRLSEMAAGRMTTAATP